MNATSIQTIEKMNHEPPHIPGNTAINLKTGETLPINTNTFSDAPKTAMPNASNYPTSTGITTYDVSKHRLDEEYPSEHHDTVLHNAKEKVKEVAHETKEACGHAVEKVKEKLHDAKVSVAGH